MRLFDSTGRPRTLASTPFAEGGEGKVHYVVGEPSIVAKVYKKSLAAEQATKLAAMVRLATPELLKVAAWPTETLHSRPSGPVTGILMPRLAAEFRDIFHLYNPDQRKQDYPDADWRFLIHAARNCTIAFERIHAAGHVIGDVNQKNILVSPRGIVHLVDCDSFQIRDSTGKIYRCEVGVPDFTPPELQGQAFQNVDRTANHDRFGLAILIFQLLMIGRHPYAGVYAGPGEMPMQKAISTGRFAYSRSPSKTQMTPPPHAPSIGLLDAKLIDLFELAFTKHGSIRPSPREWYESLDAFSNQLKKCDTDSKHLFPRFRNICPWCELIKRTGGHVFSPSLKTKTTNKTSFVLADVWAQIEAIRIPQYSYMRPPTTLPAYQPGKPVPLALAHYAPEPMPLSPNLGLHAPRPVLPHLTRWEDGLFEPEWDILAAATGGVHLTRREDNSVEPEPPPDPSRDHAPRPRPPVVGDHSLRPKPPVIGDHAPKPQPPVIGDHTSRPAPPYHGDHAPKPQPPVIVDHAPRPNPPVIVDHAPRPRKLRQTLAEHYSLHPERLAADLGDHAPRPKQPGQERSNTSSLIVLSGLISLALLPNVPVVGTTLLGGWVGLLISTLVTRSSRLEQRIQRRELAMQTYACANATWQADQADWLAKELKFRRDWAEQEQKRCQDEQQLWDQRQQEWEHPLQVEWEHACQKWKGNQTKWIERQTIEWEFRLGEWLRNQREWELRLPKWEQDQQAWEERLKSEYSAQLIRWEQDQQVWEERLKSEYGAQLIRWEQDQQAWEERLKSEYSAQLIQWERDQQAWENRLMVEWQNKHQRWKEAKRKVEKHNQHINKWQELCRDWQIKQVEWENAIRTRWGMEHRIWKANHLRWLGELQERDSTRKLIFNTVIHHEAVFERDLNRSLSAIKSCRFRLGITRQDLERGNNIYQKNRANLADTNQKSQKNQYLASCFIADATIDNITSRRLASLHSSGITTALDVARLKNKKVPDIGHISQMRLFQWYDRCVGAFQYDSTQPSNEMIALEQAHLAQVGPWEAELAAGPGQLRELVDRLQAHQATALQQIQAVVDQLHQAELDVAVMERLMA